MAGVSEELNAPFYLILIDLHLDVKPPVSRMSALWSELGAPWGQSNLTPSLSGLGAAGWGGWIEDQRGQAREASLMLVPATDDIFRGPPGYPGLRGLGGAGRGAGRGCVRSSCAARHGLCHHPRHLACHDS